MTKKKVKKAIKKEPSPIPEKRTHLFRKDRVEAKKKEGWKEIDINKITDKHGRLLGVNTHGEGELVLMEK